MTDVDLKIPLSRSLSRRWLYSLGGMSTATWMHRVITQQPGSLSPQLFHDAPEQQQPFGHFLTVE